MLTAHSSSRTRSTIPPISETTSSTFRGIVPPRSVRSHQLTLISIHMIPLQPFSALIRTKKFVAEEWNTYFAPGAVVPANNVNGGWRGILYANLAIIDPKTSFNFFSQKGFDPSWLDGGASQTWYLAYAAGKHSRRGRLYRRSS